MLLMSVVIFLFSPVVSLIFLNFLLGFSGAIVVLESCTLGLIVFYLLMEFSRVTLWVHFCFH